MAKQQDSQLDIVRTLLDNSFIDHNKILIEKEIAANGKPFEMRRNIIAHRDINFLLFRFDTKTRLFPYFNELSGLNKVCDYILFVEEADHLYLLLIELKKGKESALKQLAASESFAHFIIASARRIGILLTENIHIKKIRISDERAKRRNRGSKIKELLEDENGIINYDHSCDFRIKELLQTH